MFENAHDCRCLIGLCPGLTADLESIEEIVKDCEERFKESFDTETLNETNISVGEVKGVAFSSTFQNDDNERYAIDLAVPLSGEDMYRVAFWFPEDYSKRLGPIVTHAFDSITLEEAEAPILKEKDVREQVQQPKEEGIPTHTAPAASFGTLSQKNAVAQAKSYLAYSSFSYRA